MKNAFLNGITVLKMLLIKHLHWDPLIRRTKSPRAAQTRLLLRILKQNKDTRYGREHGFTNIRTIDEFRDAVPVNHFEALRDYIERQEAENKPHLNSEQPVMYAQTSGSTGQPKYIPILRRTIKQFRRSQHIVAYAKYLAIPGVFAGKVLAIVSPAVEGHLETGTDFGSMSGLIYKSMPRIVRAKYVVPPNVFELADYERKYYLITRHALAEPNISMIATANPSTLMKIDEIMNARAAELIQEIGLELPDRATELQDLLNRKGMLVFADVWPDLKSVTTWTAGNCGVLIPALKEKLPDATKIVEMGYLSSEFRGGITVDVLNNRQVPALHENFFEFVEKDLWESGAGTFLTLDEVETGKQYYVFTTTQGGLYRYDIDDIIEVNGRFNQTPTIRFVQKGKGVTNLTGEKLYESQLIEAIEKLAETQNIELRFFMMIGRAEDLEYTLYLEHDPFDASTIEPLLFALNTEFEAKRKSGRLKPVRIVFVRDETGEAYKREALKSGQREGQFKFAHLQYRENCSFDFSSYIRETSNSAA